MKRMLYQSVKIAVGTISAVFIAQWLGLTYATTAGIIALLSILDTRKQTYFIGLKRIITSFAAIILASVVFNFAGHTLMALGIFLLVFVPSLTWLRSTEGLSIATVLVMHVYTIQSLGISVVLNEMGLMVIGVLVAFVLNLHMISMEGEIKLAQEETEKQIKEILNKMKLQLLNQCSVTEQENLLGRLDDTVSQGLMDAITYDNNYILKDYSYYAHYFRMRRQQLFVLRAMERHFETIFIAVEEAKLLSEFTAKMALVLNECNDGRALLTELEDLREHYRKTPLPVTRDEFENRATLFQYMNDLEYFVNIKTEFMVAFGEIQYCE